MDDKQESLLASAAHEAVAAISNVLKSRNMIGMDDGMRLVAARDRLTTALATVHPSTVALIAKCSRALRAEPRP